MNDDRLVADLEVFIAEHRFHAKYDPDLARLWGGAVMPPNRVMFRIVPEHVRNWGLGG